MPIFAELGVGCTANGDFWGIAREDGAELRMVNGGLRTALLCPGNMREVPDFACYSQANAMIFSRDYVGYLARQTVKHLIEAKMVDTGKLPLVNERVTTAMVDELSLEDRINDEVRVILEAIQEDMRKGGVSYPEMFKKVKQKLVTQYKAVL